MPFSLLLTVSGIVGLVFGAAFFISPAWTLGHYGASTGEVGYLMARFTGAGLFHLGIVYLMIRDIRDAVLIRRLAIASTLGALAGLRAALYAVRNDLVNNLGWSTVVIYAVLAAGFGWFAFRPSRTA